MSTDRQKWLAFKLLQMYKRYEYSMISMHNVSKRNTAHVAKRTQE
jgi:hypothetical protein